LITQVSIQGEWQPWSNKVPQIEVETHKVAAPDIVVPTLDTVRHESLLYTWLAEHKPLGNTLSGFFLDNKSEFLPLQFFVVRLVQVKR
jgi:hypothetical protein